MPAEKEGWGQCVCVQKLMLCYLVLHFSRIKTHSCLLMAFFFAKATLPHTGGWGCTEAAQQLCTVLRMLTNTEGSKNAQGAASSLQGGILVLGFFLWNPANNFQNQPEFSPLNQLPTSPSSSHPGAERKRTLSAHEDCINLGRRAA